jgi:type I restriction enzyme S subunit
LNSGFIGDITTAIIDYRGRTPPKSADGIKLLTAKVIKDGTIDESRLEYISEETYASWMRRGFPQQWDILLTTEAPLGEVSLLRSPEPVALAQRVILLRGDPSVVDQLYLFAALRSPLMQDRLRQRATGTTVLGIKQRELRQVEVPLPPLPTQRRIAAILSAYDDLIENNNRRIKLLDEMAQRIYREWFVDFRYPGHEHSPLVDSELGPAPQGWTVRPLSTLVESVRVATAPGRPETVGVPYVPIDCISAKSLCLREWQSGENAKSSLIRFARHDVLFGAMRPYFHKVAIAPFAGTTRSTCFVIRAREERMWALAVMTLFDDRTVDFATRHSSGSTIPYARWGGAMGDMLSLHPTLDIATAFEDLMAPILRRLTDAGAIQANLRATRDILLPRLISGEVDVTNLDIAMPEEAA